MFFLLFDFWSVCLCFTSILSILCYIFFCRFSRFRCRSNEEKKVSCWRQNNIDQIPFNQFDVHTFTNIRTPNDVSDSNILRDAFSPLKRRQSKLSPTLKSLKFHIKEYPLLDKIRQMSIYWKLLFPRFDHSMGPFVMFLPPLTNCLLVFPNCIVHFSLIVVVAIGLFFQFSLLDTLDVQWQWIQCSFTIYFIYLYSCSYIDNSH